MKEEELKQTEERDGTLNNEELQQIGKQVVKKRGAKSASIEVNNTAKRDEISQIIHESYRFFNLPIVQTDEECAERLNWYFTLCNNEGQLPTVEDMCLALGAVRQTVWNWEKGHGCSSARMDMIKKAKEILAGIDAKLVSQGKIPQITYIFRAKNFFGLSDKQEVVVTPNQPLGGESDPAELAKRIEESVVDIGDE